MESIKNVNISNKKVILRVDYNVTIKDGIIIDNTKIKKSLKTINYLLENNNKLLIMSHLGRVKTEEDKLVNDLSIVAIELEKLLGREISFINDTRGMELEKSFNNNEITLMQNTRYEDLNQESESKCNMELASYWANLGEVFVNDAFATTHRKHASNYGIKSYLPSYYGFLIEEEVKGLDPVINVSKRPFVVLMGGAKVDDKIKLIETIVDDCDYILLGGGIANTFLKAKGYEIGDSLYSADYVEQIKSLIEKYSNKIILPADFIVEKNGVSEYRDINNVNKDEIIYDIGENSVNMYIDYLKKAEVIFINGTVGLYENELYKKGTDSILNSLSECNGIKIVGGGDAVSAINNLGYQDNADYLSTGGGATLEYIANKELKCFGE